MNEADVGLVHQMKNPAHCWGLGLPWGPVGLRNTSKLLQHDWAWKGEPMSPTWLYTQSQQ